MFSSTSITSEDHGEPAQKQQEGAVCALAAARCIGTRDDLSAQHVAQLPAEAVARAVEGDHRGWRRGRRGVAFEAVLVVSRWRGGQERIAAGRRVALGDELLRSGSLAEHVDDVGLPVGGPVRRVGRVQRRLLVSCSQGIAAAAARKLVCAAQAGMVCGRKRTCCWSASNGAISFPV